MTETRPFVTAIDFSKYSQAGIEEIFLGWAYRERHSLGDRRPLGEVAADIDWTGYPKTRAGLLLPSRATPGIEVALKTTHFPDKWAANLILRGDRGEGGPLWDIPRVSWDAEETRLVTELSYLWQKAAVVMSEKGWAELAHPSPYKLEKEYVDGVSERGGLPKWWHLTYKGLDHAEQVIPGTCQEKGPHSKLAIASDEVREHVKANVPWAYEEWQKESGDGT